MSASVSSVRTSKSNRSMKFDATAPSCFRILSNVTTTNNTTPTVHVNPRKNKVVDDSNHLLDRLSVCSSENESNDERHAIGEENHTTKNLSKNGINANSSAINADARISLSKIGTPKSDTDKKEEDGPNVPSHQTSQENNDDTDQYSSTSQKNKEDTKEPNTTTPKKATTEEFHQQSKKTTKSSPSSVIQFDNLACLAELQQEYQNEYFKPPTSVIVTKQSSKATLQAKEQGNATTSSTARSATQQTPVSYNPYSSQPVQNQHDDDDDNYSVQSGYSQISYMSNMSSVSNYTNMSTLSQMSRVQDMISLLQTETSRRRQRKQRLRDREKTAVKKNLVAHSTSMDRPDAGDGMRSTTSNLINSSQRQGANEGMEQARRPTVGRPSMRQKSHSQYLSTTKEVE